MPGSVANAAPSTVLPLFLSRAFRKLLEYPVPENDYRGGESQRSLSANTSRKRWSLALRLTPAALAALRTFYDARGGPHEPFFYYDPFETVPRFNYDPTGATVAGRYTVRFEGPWQQIVGLGRSDVQIELVELA